MLAIYYGVKTYLSFVVTEGPLVNIISLTVFSALIDSLISSSFDKDADTKHAICTSLSYFGKKQPNLVLGALHTFLLSHTKVLR